jgi:AAT family amino acid transporter
VLISYLVAGTLIILVMWALGEMAAANPDSGAFSVYTAKAYGPVAGATVGWLWWIQLVVVIAAEALGAAGLLATIFPALPVWLMAFVFIVVLTAVNLTSVKKFEFEFWFALLKVAAIVGFVLVGFALLFGLVPGVQSPGLSNFTGEGFADNGFGVIATALFVVAFASGGTEIVSVAAAETAEPARSVKKAVRTVLWRILLFYIGAIFVIAAVVPVGSAGLKSPFAAVLNAAGMLGAATAITLVAVAALLSALNANLYGASRMAYSLAERGEAPRWLASVSEALVPVFAVLASVAFGVVTVVLESAFPEKVLPVLLNIVGSTCLLVWTSALLAQLALRLRVDRDGTELPMRMPGFPWLTSLGLLILAEIFTVSFIGEDSRPQLLSTFGLVAVLALGCWLNHRNRKVSPVEESPERAQKPALID